MTSPRTSGRAGKYSRKMQRRSGLRAFGWACAAALAAVLALLLLTHHNYRGALIGALIAAVCGAASRHHLTRAGKQGVGAKAEQQVSAALKRTDAFHVINNAVLRGVSGDADHVVLTPRGVALIETKSGGGQVRINNDGQLVTGQGRIVPGSPVDQAIGQARALARLTGAHVTPIVCAPWMANPPFRSRGVWICSTKQLAWVLRQMDDHLTSQAADQYARHIRR